MPCRAPGAEPGVPGRSIESLEGNSRAMPAAEADREGRRLGHPAGTAEASPGSGAKFTAGCEGAGCPELDVGMGTGTGLLSQLSLRGRARGRARVRCWHVTGRDRDGGHGDGTRLRWGPGGAASWGNSRRSMPGHVAIARPKSPGFPERRKKSTRRHMWATLSGGSAVRRVRRGTHASTCKVVAVAQAQQILHGLAVQSVQPFKNAARTQSASRED